MIHSLFNPPQINDLDKVHSLHLFWIIEGLVALSFTVESIFEIFFIPENTLRWLLIIFIINSVALILFAIARSGSIRLSGILFVVVLWALVTGLAFTENGIRSPTADIAYLVIIVVAGLVIDERAGILTGIVCALTLLILALAGVKGLLPENRVHRTILTTWEADVFYLGIVIGLQYIAIHTIKEALAQTHRELLERRRVEKNLRQSEQERAQSQMRVELHHLLEEKIENERLKIARDLHDGPVQDLIGATFTLESLIEDSSNEQFRKDLQDIQQVLRDQVVSLRAFAGELRSPTLAKFGLVRAIQEHIQTFQEKYSQVQINFEASERAANLPEEIRLTLFRIYQEVMNNIVKHAQATEINIRIQAGEHCVQLEIQDNGVGFTPPENWMELARHGHLGLVGMRERAEMLGGKFEIVSEENNGTTVQVKIPEIDAPAKVQSPAVNR